MQHISRHLQENISKIHTWGGRGYSTYNTRCKGLISTGPVQGGGDRATDLWHQILKRVHDAGAFGLLIVGEASRYHDNSRQHNAQVELWVIDMSNECR